MKNFKKAILALIITTGSMSFANAQRLDLGAHVIPSIPVGDLGEVDNFGFGFDVFADYYFNENFSAGVEIGSLTYKYEVTLPFFGTQSFRFGLIPLVLNGDYHLDADNEIDFFFGTGVGLYAGSGDANGSNLGFSPHAGTSIELSDELRAHGKVAFMLVPEDGFSTNALNFHLGLSYTVID